MGESLRDSLDGEHGLGESIDESAREIGDRAAARMPSSVGEAVGRLLGDRE